MKTEEELRARVRELIEGELRRRLEATHEKLPHLCTHNYRHALDTRKAINDEANEGYNRIGDVLHLPLAQTMGLCMLGANDPEQWKGDICDEPIDAQRCPFFKPKKTDAEVTSEFRAQVKDPAWVSENLPAVAALLWVSSEPSNRVHQDLAVAEGPDPAAVAEEPDPAPAPVAEESKAQEPAALAVVRPRSWWRRLVDWLMGNSGAGLSS